MNKFSVKQNRPTKRGGVVNDEYETNLTNQLTPDPNERYKGRDYFGFQNSDSCLFDSAAAAQLSMAV